MMVNAPVTGPELDVLGLELLVLVLLELVVVTALLEELEVLELVVTEVVELVVTELLVEPFGNGKKLATRLKPAFWLTILASSILPM